MELEKYVLSKFKTGQIYNFIGGGGKSSIMDTVGKVLSENGVKVIISTTTKFDKDEFKFHKKFQIDPSLKINNDYFLEQDNTLNIPLIKKDILRDCNSLVIYKEDLRAINKYKAFEPLVFSNIPQENLEDLVILIEGDGAKRKPYKIPREFDPDSIKGSTTIFMCGALFFQEKIDSPSSLCNFVHGPLEQLEGSRAEDLEPLNIAQEIIGNYYLNPSGQKKYGPLEIFINQVDNQELYYLALQLKNALGEEFNNYGNIHLLSNKNKTYYQDNFITLILGGGESKRFAGNKILSPISNQNLDTFLDVVISRNMHYSKKIYIALGYYYNQVEEYLNERLNAQKYAKYKNKIHLIKLKNYEGGMGASLSESIGSILNSQVNRGNGEIKDSLLLELVDYPYIKGETIKELIYEFCKGDTSMVYNYGTLNKELKCHPKMFIYEDWLKLLKSKGTYGAKDIMLEMDLRYLVTQDYGVLNDIDKKEDLIDD